MGMVVALNPFVWDRPLDDPSKIIGMDAFANQLARASLASLRLHLSIRAPAASALRWSA